VTYTVHFDARHLDGRDWVFTGAALLMIVIGLGLVLWRKPLQMGAFFPFLFFGISVTIGLLVGFGTWFGKQTGLPNKLRLGQCAVVEDVVTDFRPMPPEGGTESFRAGGQRFEYAAEASSSMSGFSEPGVLSEGLAVRIHHVDGAISRLEIDHD